MASEKTWMIYGANGYTGKLIAERAKEQGETPILAGRSNDEIQSIAKRLQLPCTSFSLENPTRVIEELASVDAVLHCAGPFSSTSEPMVSACLKAKTSYLDITGEIPVFESIFAQDQKAKESGVVLMPGVGFDVVPSDCLAAALHEKLPDATELELAFVSQGEASPGTLKTVVEKLPKGGAIRKNGRIVEVPAAHKTKMIPFASKERLCVSFPWGDVSTAYYSTEIPNIIVYVSMPNTVIWGMKASRFLKPVLGASSVQTFLKRKIEEKVKGPGQEELATLKVELWGCVKNQNGQSVEGFLEVPHGYETTVRAALVCVKGLLSEDISPGAKTPTMAFGAKLIDRIDGATLSF